jgi:WD40 repeat protein
MTTEVVPHPETPSQPLVSSSSRPVFLCYRQIDGKRHARWLFSTLRESLEERGEDPDIYFDQTAPATTNWKALHGPALERARAIVVICTPGFYADQGPEDWVHRELDWWLHNRFVAPIVVDTTGEGTRWLPEKLKSRWPDAQRVNLDPDLWERSPLEEAATAKRQVASQILGGIASSEISVVHEDLAKSRRLNRRLWISAVALSILSIGLAAAIYLVVRERHIAEERRIQAEKARDVALSQVLVARSRKFLAQPLDAGVLYGVEAMQLVDSPETRANLLELVQTAPTLEAVLGEIAYVHQMVFSPDGTRLATAGQLAVSGMGQGRVAMWDLETRSPLWVRSVEKNVVHLAFAPDGKSLFAVQSTPALLRLDVQSGATTDVRPLEAPGVVPIESWLQDHQMSQDGKALLAMGKGSLLQWDLQNATAQNIRLPSADQAGYVASLALGYGERKQLAIATYNTLWLWEPDNERWREIQRLGDPGPIALSPNGNVIAFADSRSVSVWNGKAGKAKRLVELKDKPSSLIWSPDGTKLAIGGKDGTVAVHFEELPNGWPVIELYGQDSEILAMAFSSDGRWLTSVSRSSRIALWNLQFAAIRQGVDKEPVLTRPRLGTRLNQIPGTKGLALNGDGSLVLSGDKSGAVILSNLEAGKRIVSFNPFSDPRLAQTVALSGDGSKIAILGGKKATLMDVKKGTRIERAADLRSITFSEDGTRMASTGQDVQIWNADSMTPLGDPIPIHLIDPITHKAAKEALTFAGIGTALAFSRDGKWLAVGAGSDAYLVNLSDQSTRERIIFGVGDELIRSIAFSPDNALLVAGMQDGSISLWDRTSGAAAGRLRGGHFFAVAALAFDRTGSQLTSLDENGVVVRWQMDPRSWLAAACRLVNRNLFPDERFPLIEGRPSDHSCPSKQTFFDLLSAAAQ